MNLNLAEPDPAGELAAHREILTRRLFPNGEGLLSQWPVLVPLAETGSGGLPVYEVWWPTADDTFVYITPDGEMIAVDFLPTTEDWCEGGSKI